MSNEKWGASVRAVLIFGLLSGLAIADAAHAQPRLNKKEVKTLLSTATTAEDHQRLAAYYHEKARRADAASERFAKQAEFIERQSKPGVPSATAKSYRYSSRQYAEDAWEAEALAADQEKLAQAVLTKTETKK